MVKHDCDNCSREAESCYCEKCLEEIKSDSKKEGYDEGYTDGAAEAEAGIDL